MDGRKIDKLIASCAPPADRNGEGYFRALQSECPRHSWRLRELSESLFEAVDIAARQISGLLDDPVAR